MDGVIKARETVLIRLQKLYIGSSLQLWREAYRILKLNHR